jgi:hypothetical protein
MLGMVSQEAGRTNADLEQQFARADFGMHNNAIRHGTISDVNVESGTGTREVTSKTEINITIPPGTPEEQARRIGRESQAGVEKGNRNLRAAHAAIVQGKG